MENNTNPNVDERVVQMSFDNQQFEEGVSQSLKTIKDLKQALQFDKLGESFSEVESNTGMMSEQMSKLEANVERASTALTTFFGKLEQKYLDRAVSKVEELTVSFAKFSTGLEGLDAGQKKYENYTKAVQTITNATGKSIDDVKKSLDVLAKYTDETSYDFSTMVGEIGKFTSVGIDLERAEKAMEGIANWAAKAGAGKMEANRAMYNISQAMGAGAMKLMDWKSIENANMGTKEFKELAIETAVELGKLQRGADGVAKIVIMDEEKMAEKQEALVKAEENLEYVRQKIAVSSQKTAAQRLAAQHSLQKAEEAVEKARKNAEGGAKETPVNYQTFRETLKGEWLDAEVMMATLEKYSDTTTEFGQAAFNAAKEYLTFSDVIDAANDAISTGWMRTFELLFGKLDEAKEFWQQIGDTVIEFASIFSEARNEVLEGWHEMGGYDTLFQAIGETLQALMNIAYGVKEALEEIFPPFLATDLTRITNKIKAASSSLLGAFELDKVETISQTLTTVIDKTDELNDTLQKGDKSGSVTNLQHALADAGYLAKGFANGIYGDETIEAVKNLQTALGVKVTGAWDKATWMAARKAGTFAKTIEREISGTVFNKDYIEDEYGNIQEHDLTGVTTQMLQLKSIIKGIASVAKIAVDSVMNAFNIIKNVVMNTLSPLIGPLTRFGAMIGEMLKKLQYSLAYWRTAEKISDSIISMLGPIGNVIQYIADSLDQMMQLYATWLYYSDRANTFTNFFEFIVAYIQRTFLPGIMDFGKMLVQTVIEFGMQIAPIVIGVVSEIAGKVSVIGMSLIQNIVGFISSAGTWIVPAIINIGAKVVNTVSGFVTSVVDKIKSLFAKDGLIGKAIAKSKLENGFLAAVSSIFESVKTIFTSIGNFVSGSVGSIFGADSVKTTAKTGNKIVDVFNTVRDTVTNLANALAGPLAILAVTLPVVLGVASKVVNPAIVAITTMTGVIGAAASSGAIKTFPDLLKTLWDAFKATGVGKWVNARIEDIKGFVKSITDQLAVTFPKTVEAFNNAVGKLKDIFKFDPDMGFLENIKAKFEQFKLWLEGLRGRIETAFNGIGKFFKKIFARGDDGKIHIFDNIKAQVMQVEPIAEMLNVASTKIGDATKNIVTALDPETAEKAKSGPVTVLDGIKALFSYITSFDFGTVGKMALAVLGAFAIAKVAKTITAFTSAVADEGIKGVVMNGIGGDNKSFGDSFQQFALSVVAMSLSLALLSTIKIGDALQGLGALAGMLTIMIVAGALYKKFVDTHKQIRTIQRTGEGKDKDVTEATEEMVNIGEMLMEFAKATIYMAIGLKAMSMALSSMVETKEVTDEDGTKHTETDISALVGTFITIVGLVAGLIYAQHMLNNVLEDGQEFNLGEQIKNFATGIILIAIGFKLMKEATGGVNPGEYVKVMLTIALILGAFLGIAFVIHKYGGVKEGEEAGEISEDTGESILNMCKGIIAIAVGFKILADVVKDIDDKTFGRAFGVVGGLLLELGVIEVLIAALGKGDGAGENDASVILNMCIGLMVLAHAVQKMADVYSKMDKGFWSSFGSVAILLAELGAIEVLVSALGKGLGTGFGAGAGVLVMCLALAHLVKVLGETFLAIKDIDTEKVDAFMGNLNGTIFLLGLLVTAMSAIGWKSLIGDLGVAGFGVALATLINNVSIALANAFTNFASALWLCLTYLGQVKAQLENVDYDALEKFLTFLKDTAPGIVGSARNLEGTDAALAKLYQLESMAISIKNYSNQIRLAVQDGLDDSDKAITMMEKAQKIATAVNAITAPSLTQRTEVMGISSALMTYSGELKNIVADESTFAAAKRYAEEAKGIADDLNALSLKEGAAPAIVDIGAALSLYYKMLAGIGQVDENGAELDEKFKMVHLNFNPADVRGAFEALRDAMPDDATLGTIVSYGQNDNFTSTGGGMTKFALGLEAIGTALKSYGDNIKDISPENVEAANETLDKLSEIGISSSLEGSNIEATMNSLSEVDNFSTMTTAFTERINHIGTALGDYIGAINGIKKDDVEAANLALEEFIKLAKDLGSNDDYKVDWDSTYEVIDTLGEVMDEFGNVNDNTEVVEVPHITRLAKFGHDIQEIAIAMNEYLGKIKGIDDVNTDKAQGVLSALGDLANALPKDKGVLQWFTGTNSNALQNLAVGVTALGPALYTFFQGYELTDDEGVTHKQSGIGAIEESVLNHMDAYERIFTMISDLANTTQYYKINGDQFGINSLAGDVESMGGQIKNFYDNLKDVDTDKVDKGLAIIKDIIGFVEYGAQIFQDNTGYEPNLNISGQYFDEWGNNFAGMIQAVTGAFASANNWYNTAETGVTVWEKLGELGGVFLANIAKGIETANTGHDVGDIAKAINTAIENAIAIVKADKSIYEKMKSLGKWLGEGIVVGISDKTSSVAGVMTKLAKDGIIGPVAKETQTNSPSRKFIWFADMMALGLKQGFENNTDIVRGTVFDFIRHGVNAPIEKEEGIHSPAEKFSWYAEMMALGLKNGFMKYKDLVKDATMDFTKASIEDIIANMDLSSYESMQKIVNAGNVTYQHFKKNPIKQPPGVTKKGDLYYGFDGKYEGKITKYITRVGNDIDKIKKEMERGADNDEESVRVLQHILKKFNYGDVKINGNFDEATEKSLKVMQKDLGVEETGKWDKKTIDAAKRSRKYLFNYRTYGDLAEGYNEQGNLQTMAEYETGLNEKYQRALKDHIDDQERVMVEMRAVEYDYADDIQVGLKSGDVDLNNERGVMTLEELLVATGRLPQAYVPSGYYSSEIIEPAIKDLQSELFNFDWKNKLLKINTDTLEYGDSGYNVRALNEALYEMGFFNEEMLQEERYGYMTTKGLTQFQKDQGLILAEMKDLQQIQSDSLKFGDTSEEVQILKNIMHTLGLLSDDFLEGGYYGRSLVDAVKTYQEASGLKATGEYDAATKEYMMKNSVYGKYNAATKEAVANFGVTGEWDERTAKAVKESGMFVVTEWEDYETSQNAYNKMYIENFKALRSSNNRTDENLRLNYELYKSGYRDSFTIMKKNQNGREYYELKDGELIDEYLEKGFIPSEGMYAYDKNTVESVKAYQTDLGLEATGVFDQLSREAGIQAGIYSDMYTDSAEITRLQDEQSAALREQAKWSKELAKFQTKGNVDLYHRPRVSGETMRNAGYEDFEDDDYATVYSHTFSAGPDNENIDFKADKNMFIDVTPILPDGTVLSSENVKSYVGDVLLKSGRPILEADMVENGGLGIVLNVQDDIAKTYKSWDEAYEKYSFGEDLHEAQEGYYDAIEAVESTGNALKSVKDDYKKILGVGTKKGALGSTYYYRRGEKGQKEFMQQQSEIYATIDHEGMRKLLRDTGFISERAYDEKNEDSYAWGVNQAKMDWLGYQEGDKRLNGEFTLDEIGKVYEVVNNLAYQETGTAEEIGDAVYNKMSFTTFTDPDKTTWTGKYTDVNIEARKVAAMNIKDLAYKSPRKFLEKMGYLGEGTIYGNDFQAGLMAWRLESGHNNEDTETLKSDWNESDAKFAEQLVDNYINNPFADEVQVSVDEATMDFYRYNGSQDMYGDKEWSYQDKVFNAGNTVLTPNGIEWTEGGVSKVWSTDMGLYDDKVQKGTTVRNMEDILNNIPGIKLGRQLQLDGVFDEEDKAAIEALQQLAGLDVTGEWDQQTREYVAARYEDYYWHPEKYPNTNLDMQWYMVPMGAEYVKDQNRRNVVNKNPTKQLLDKDSVIAMQDILVHLGYLAEGSFQWGVEDENTRKANAILWEMMGHDVNNKPGQDAEVSMTNEMYREVMQLYADNMGSHERVSNDLRTRTMKDPPTFSEESWMKNLFGDKGMNEMLTPEANFVAENFDAGSFMDNIMTGMQTSISSFLGENGESLFSGEIFGSLKDTVGGFFTGEDGILTSIFGEGAVFGEGGFMSNWINKLFGTEDISDAADIDLEGVTEGISSTLEDATSGVEETIGGLGEMFQGEGQNYAQAAYDNILKGMQDYADEHGDEYKDKMNEILSNPLGFFKGEDVVTDNIDLPDATNTNSAQSNINPVSSKAGNYNGLAALGGDNGVIIAMNNLTAILMQLCAILDPTQSGTIQNGSTDSGISLVLDDASSSQMRTLLSETGTAVKFTGETSSQFASDIGFTSYKDSVLGTDGIKGIVDKIYKDIGSIKDYLDENHIGGTVKDINSSLASQGIYLNGSKLVGYLLPDIDTGLGYRQSRQRRNGAV